MQRLKIIHANAFVHEYLYMDVSPNYICPKWISVAIIWCVLAMARYFVACYQVWSHVWNITVSPTV